MEHDPVIEALIDGLCAMTELQTGPFATRTRARYALFLELAGDPELSEPLRRQRLEFQRWTEQLVTTAGIADLVTRQRQDSERLQMRGLDQQTQGVIIHLVVIQAEPKQVRQP